MPDAGGGLQFRGERDFLTMPASGFPGSPTADEPLHAGRRRLTSSASSPRDTETAGLTHLHSNCDIGFFNKPENAPFLRGTKFRVDIDILFDRQNIRCGSGFDREFLACAG